MVRSGKPGRGRPRPVFDPSLPARVRRRLERRRDELIPRADRPPARNRVLGYGVAATVLAATWGSAYLSPFAPEFGALAVRILATLGLGALVYWGLRQGGRLGGTLALLLVWGPLFLVWTVGREAALSGSATFFWTAGPVAALIPLVRTIRPSPLRYHGRYMVPADFSSSDAVLLARLQTSIDVVKEATIDLGDDVGPGRDEAWLREQEWSVATSLVNCSGLQKDLDERVRAAETDRVITSLSPQRKALETARSAVAERVRLFEEYAERASSAATTYRELRQCEENERRNDAFLNLLTTAVSESGEKDALGESHIRPLQESLDEQVTQTVTAGRWLIESLEEREGKGIESSTDEK